MREDTLKYIKITLSVGLILVIMVMAKNVLVRPKIAGQAKITKPQKIEAPPAVSEPVIYDIQKAKSVSGTEYVSSGKEPSNIEDVYKMYPREDVGDNMPEAWARINPEEKTKFTRGLDEQIESCKNLLKVNPADKKARGLLVISESLKKAASADFDFKNEKQALATVKDGGTND